MPEEHDECLKYTMRFHFIFSPVRGHPRREFIVVCWTYVRVFLVCFACLPPTDVSYDLCTTVPCRRCESCLRGVLHHTAHVRRLPLLTALVTVMSPSSLTSGEERRREDLAAGVLHSEPRIIKSGKIGHPNEKGGHISRKFPKEFC